MCTWQFNLIKHVYLHYYNVLYSHRMPEYFSGVHVHVYSNTCVPCSTLLKYNKQDKLVYWRHKHLDLVNIS